MDDGAAQVKGHACAYCLCSAGNHQLVTIRVVAPSLVWLLPRHRLSALLRLSRLSVGRMPKHCVMACMSLASKKVGSHCLMTKWEPAAAHTAHTKCAHMIFGDKARKPRRSSQLAQLK